MPTRGSHSGTLGNVYLRQQPRMCNKTDATSTSFPSFGLLKRASCVLLIFFTVSATVFTEASKLENGTYPYNTFVIPCAVEALKLAFSSYMLMSTRLTSTAPKKLGFTLQRFAAYAFPALCYFVSNNCMFYIIRHLGATTFQIMNNLKVLSTGVFMYVFLNRKLSWLQWKALIILVVGCMVTQLSETENGASLADSRSSLLVGYSLVLTSAVASGAGGAFSEKLLKGKGFEQWGLKDSEDSIHWQNIQLYVFGLFFGLVSLRMDENVAAQAGQLLRRGPQRRQAGHDPGPRRRSLGQAVVRECGSLKQVPSHRPVVEIRFQNSEFHRAERAGEGRGREKNIRKTKKVQWIQVHRTLLMQL